MPKDFIERVKSELVRRSWNSTPEGEDALYVEDAVIVFEQSLQEQRKEIGEEFKEWYINSEECSLGIEKAIKRITDIDVNE